MKIFPLYTLVARIFPTIIGLLPFFVFQYIFLNNIVSIDSVIISAVGNVSLPTIILYAFNQYFVRIPSKLFEDFLFKKRLWFPTTSFLLYSNKEYTDDFKDRIRELVATDFRIQLPDKEAELKSELEARKRISEVIGVIIGKVKDGHLVLQHNIEYGFVRNLWGASLVGIFGSLLVIYTINPASLAWKVCAISFIVYLAYLLFGFVIIRYLGRAYARKLIEEYIKISHEK